MRAQLLHGHHGVLLVEQADAARTGLLRCAGEHGVFGAAAILLSCHRDPMSPNWAFLVLFPRGDAPRLYVFVDRSGLPRLTRTGVHEKSRIISRVAHVPGTRRSAAGGRRARPLRPAPRCRTTMGALQVRGRSQVATGKVHWSGQKSAPPSAGRRVEVSFDIADQCMQSLGDSADQFKWTLHAF